MLTQVLIGARKDKWKLSKGKGCMVYINLELLKLKLSQLNWPRDRAAWKDSSKHHENLRHEVNIDIKISLINTNEVCNVT